MNKRDIIDFFNHYAPNWDADQPCKDDVIGKILDNARVGEGVRVLDVACGTGILFQHYLQRGVASVTGIDIAPEMAKIAAQKYPDDARVQVVCGDVEEAAFEHNFDVVMVYNAFPHFPEPEKLIEKLASLLRKGGRLSIAHGASREQIDAHHQGSASKVSNGLMHAEDLKKLFDPWFDVDILISDDEMYQVCGMLR